jgi:hypothetical protein
VKHNIDRRAFIQQCAATGAGAIVGSLVPNMLLGNNSGSSEITLCAVTGSRIFENTMTAVDALGGMKRFVQKGASVALLINSVFDRPGTYVHPDVALAVAKMCFDAGAGHVATIEDTPGSYFRRGTYSEKLSREIKLIGHSSDKTDVKIAKGKVLQEARVSSALLAADVFINVPIIKDHRGVHYTGNLKNMMGACASSTCQRCHFGDQSILTGIFQGYYGKPELLDTHYQRPFRTGNTQDPHAGGGRHEQRRGRYVLREPSRTEPGRSSHDPTRSRPWPRPKEPQRSHNPREVIVDRATCLVNSSPGKICFS